jgi:Pectate lyase superfamily protein
MKFVSAVTLLAVACVAPPTVLEIAPSAPALEAGDRLFPARAVIDVKTQYGASGNGADDDTDEIQRAISDHVGSNATLYFSNGTYLVSRPLEWKRATSSDTGPWRNGLTLQGQHRERSIIRLVPNAVGFGDVNAPRGVIVTASSFYFNQGVASPPVDGSGNNAFNNYLFDLTVDAGAHRGAFGVDWLATNVGAIRHVTIIGGGVAGIAMRRGFPGPSLLQHVSIQGFDYGVDVQHYVASTTLEHVTLRDQRVAGIRNRNNALFVRRLESQNRVPAIQNLENPRFAQTDGTMIVVDSRFIGGANDVAAVQNTGQSVRGLGAVGALYLRNVSTQGYAAPLSFNGALVLNGHSQISEYSSHPRVHPSAASDTSNWSLPVRESFDLHDSDLSAWANVETYGARGRSSDGSPDPGDDTDAIRAALADTRKRTVYFPQGTYRVSGTLEIGAHVRRVIGMHAILDVSGGAFSAQPVIRVRDGDPAQPVVIERFKLEQGRGRLEFFAAWFEHASARPLLLRHVGDFARGAHGFYRNTVGAGALFVEDTASNGPWHFDAPQDVWARQFNPEGHFTDPTQPLVSKLGGRLWVLGLKTEGENTVLEQRGGAAEVLGGLLYPSRPVPAQDRPAFLCRDAACRLGFVDAGERLNGQLEGYTLLVRDDHHGVVSDVLRFGASDDTRVNPGGKKLPFYFGHAPE